MTRSWKDKIIADQKDGCQKDGIGRGESWDRPVANIFLVQLSQVGAINRNQVFGSAICCVGLHPGHPGI
jgi:hypothetical protein